MAETPPSATSPHASLAEALLEELAAAQPEGVSLPRLCKRLGVRMSVLLRTLAWLGDARIGEEPGVGLVEVRGEGERRIAALTESARRVLSGGG
jgi:hypothetical protein